MSTYILLLLLLFIAGVVVYTYSNKKNESASIEDTPITPKKDKEFKVNPPSSPSKPIDEHKKTEPTPKADEPAIPKTKKDEPKVEPPKMPSIPIEKKKKPNAESPSEITPVEKPKTKSIAEFYTLSDWMYQSTLFNILKRINFFRDYLKFKLLKKQNLLIGSFAN